MHSWQGCRVLILELTGQCNFACRYCYAAEKKPLSMPLAVAKQAVASVAASQESQEPFLVQFTGGEPLLAAEALLKTAAWIRERKWPAVLQMQTNGSLLTAELAKQLRQYGVGVGVSVDGRPAVHDQMRCFPDGKGTMQSVALGMKNLAEEKCGAGVTCVVTAENVLKLSESVDMACYFGCARSLGFDLLRPRGRGDQVQAPKAAQVEQGFWQALERNEFWRKANGGALEMAQVARVDKLQQSKLACFGHCHTMTGEALYVAADGSLYACASLSGDAHFYLGRVEEGPEPLLRKRAAERICDGMAMCRNCQWLPHCGGGCFSRWYDAQGAPQNVEGECALKRTAARWWLQEHKQ